MYTRQLVSPLSTCFTLTPPLLLLMGHITIISSLLPACSLTLLPALCLLATTQREEGREPGAWAVSRKCLHVHSLSPCRPAALDCLLSVIRVLINLTHDNELGSHRVGEQKGGMEAIVGTVFQVCVCVCVCACVCQSICLHVSVYNVCARVCVCVCSLYLHVIHLSCILMFPVLYQSGVIFPSSSVTAT